MNNDFETLVEFLAKCGPEVAGRALSTPDRMEVARLERFATGACDSDERAKLCTLLRLNPTWLRWLANRVKQTRPGYEA